jgi:pSer/pThr/pTyr-binding forkhead associated (FHA) protein
MPALVVKDGPSAGQRLELSGEMELGRVSTPALQEDAEVSRRHAVVRAGAGGVEIEDLGSSNGTWVNDERVTGTRKLENGDRVRVGQTTFEVEVESAAGTVIAATLGEPPATRVAPTPSAPAPGQAQPPTETGEVARPAAAQPAEPVQPAQPAQPWQPVQPAQPQTPYQAPAQPAAPFQAQPAATAPQQPVGSQYGQPASFGQPAGAYAQPATYGRPTGRRPGSVSAAGILLLLAGILTLLWTAYDVFLLFGDLESAQAFGFSDLVYILLGLDALALVGAILEITGGIRVFSLKGRGMGITGAVLVLLSWAAAIVYIVLQGFSVTGLAWLALFVTAGLSLAALITLLAAGRAFAGPRY